MAERVSETDMFISSNSNDCFSKGTSVVCFESEEMETSSSTVKKKKKVTVEATSRPKPPPSMPPAAELEEFSSAEEKRQQKRFAEKYNYDIVKDVPMEGRYQWVPLKP